MGRTIDGAFRLLLLLVPILALSACASRPGEGTAPRTGSTFEAAAGRAYAEVWCAGCHAIAGWGPSPRMSAPPFAVLRIRYNALTWKPALDRIAAGRHEEMPALVISETDQRNIKAYIDSLR